MCGQFPVTPYFGHNGRSSAASELCGESRRWCGLGKESLVNRSKIVVIYAAALDHAQSPVAGSEHIFRYSLDPIPPIIVLIARLGFPVPLAAFVDDASGVLVSLFDYVALVVVAKRRPVHPKPVVGGVRHRLHVGGDASAAWLPWRRWRVHGYRLRADRRKQRAHRQHRSVERRVG